MHAHKLLKACGQKFEDSDVSGGKMHKQDKFMEVDIYQN